MNKEISVMKKTRFAMVLGFSVLVTGCAGALVGNVENNADNHANREQRSVEQITADGMITSAIRARYAHDVVLEKLNITTYRGVVTLYGVVPTRGVLDKAIKLAQSVKGVRKVESRLRLR